MYPLAQQIGTLLSSVHWIQTTDLLTQKLTLKRHLRNMKANIVVPIANICHELKQNSISPSFDRKSEKTITRSVILRDRTRIYLLASESSDRKIITSPRGTPYSLKNAALECSPAKLGWNRANSYRLMYGAQSYDRRKSLVLCHNEFRGSLSEIVRPVALETT
ncbi:hypothetical protein TNCV_4550111 [Trichonephila clavipes]|nr:hypothetical protein TNCV_4550111 [Trichonephila clavipes]